MLTLRLCLLPAEWGQVKCFGAGADGQLGTGTTANVGDSSTPASAAFVSIGECAVDLVSSSTTQYAALLGHDGSGSVRLWGANYGSITGLNVASNPNVGGSFLPLQATAIRSPAGAFTKIAVGASAACGLVSGAIYCWGSSLYSVTNTNLGLIPGSSGAVAAPGTLVNPGWTEPGSVTVDIRMAGGLVYVLSSAGEVRTWGDGSFGATGLGNTAVIGDNELASTVASVYYPSATVVKVASGSTTACVVLASGCIMCHGQNGEGQLVSTV